ncbi:hypothetical protein GCM10022396_39390 [Flavivirga amylovorans]
MKYVYVFGFLKIGKSNLKAAYKKGNRTLKLTSFISKYLSHIDTDLHHLKVRLFRICID